MEPPLPENHGHAFGVFSAIVGVLVALSAAIVAIPKIYRAFLSFCRVVTHFNAIAPILVQQAQDFSPRHGGRPLKAHIMGMESTLETQNRVLEKQTADQLEMKRTLGIVLADRVTAWGGYVLNEIRQRPANRCKVLVVDDEPYILLSMERLFGSEFEIITAIDAEKAIEIAQAQDIHVVVTDQRMPKTTGVEFLEMMLTLRPTAIRVLLSAYSDNNVMVDAVNRAHIYRYAQKPVDPKEMLGIIREAAYIYSMLHSAPKVEPKPMQVLT